MLVFFNTYCIGISKNRHCLLTQSMDVVNGLGQKLRHFVQLDSCTYTLSTVISCVSTVKPVLSSHSKIDKTKVLKTFGIP